jgi:hypothetical protein
VARGADAMLLQDDAADELARLRATAAEDAQEIARLRRDLIDAHQHVAQLLDEIDDMRRG